MAKGVNHYMKDGSVHRGSVHKMPNGEMHSGSRHNSSSKRLFHFSELSKTAQTKARQSRKSTKGK